jgi:hypothetical protein
MAKVKYDGVVEAVHYKPNGDLDWVRVYLRLGAAFTDRILLSRQAFVEQLKAGKRFVLGERIQYLGGVFNVTQPVHLLRQDHNPVIVVDDRQATQDDLSGVPVI